MTEEDTEDEDEDEVEEELLQSGHDCSLCSNHISLTDEVFLLRVVHPFVVDNNLNYFDIIDDLGFYKYPPAFFDFECWEDEQEEVQKIQEDVPPVRDPAGIILCDICESDICQGESMGLLEVGEIRLSERQPNGRASASFLTMGEPVHLCIACLAHLEDNQREPIWSDEIDPIPNHDVCIEGLFERCWRGNGCACPKRLCSS